MKQDRYQKKGRCHSVTRFYFQRRGGLAVIESILKLVELGSISLSSHIENTENGIQFSYLAFSTKGISR